MAGAPRARRHPGRRGTVRTQPSVKPARSSDQIPLFRRLPAAPPGGRADVDELLRQVEPLIAAR
jgi:hypothetical protein